MARHNDFLRSSCAVVALFALSLPILTLTVGCRANRANRSNGWILLHPHPYVPSDEVAVLDLDFNAIYLISVNGRAIPDDARGPDLEAQRWLVELLPGKYELEVGYLEFFGRKTIRSQYALKVTLVAQGGRYGGVEIDGETRIHALTPRGAPSPNRLINAGVYLFDRAGLKGAEVKDGTKMALESDLFQNMLREGKKFFGFVAQARFIDIGVPDDYHAAQKLFSV